MFNERKVQIQLSLEISHENYLIIDLIDQIIQLKCSIKNQI